VPSENEIRWPELDRDMIGFERKFKAELTKMRKDVEILLQFSKRTIVVVGLKEQKNEGFRIAHDDDGSRTIWRVICTKIIGVVVI